MASVVARAGSIGTGVLQPTRLRDDRVATSCDLGPCNLKGLPVEVKIGVTNAPRELTLEMSDNLDELQKSVSDALSSDSGLITFTDDRGRTVVVPAQKLAYVEIAGDSGRRVGFGTA